MFGVHFLCSFLLLSALLMHFLLYFEILPIFYHSSCFCCMSASIFLPFPFFKHFFLPKQQHSPNSTQREAVAAGLLQMFLKLFYGRPPSLPLLSHSIPLPVSRSSHCLPITSQALRQRGLLSAFFKLILSVLVSWQSESSWSQSSKGTEREMFFFFFFL